MHLPDISLAKLMTLAFGLICSSFALASNLTITPSFDASITSLSDAQAVELNINAAIAEVTSDITTATPMNISVDFGNSTDPTLLASNMAANQDIGFTQYKALLQALPNQTVNQTSAFASLSTTANTGILSGSTDISNIMLTSANLNALGDKTDAASAIALNGGFDDIVTLNLSRLNVTTLGQNNPANFDMQTVVLHEVDEALGIGGWGSTLVSGESLPSDAGVLDLYRYSAPGQHNFTSNANTAAYFSIDGGNTSLINFNQTWSASGSDAGDWGSHSGPALVQDAYILGSGPAGLSAYELTALNVIGYSLTSTGQAVVAPLPVSFWFYLTGMAGLFLPKSRSRR
jgi:hypothetical protein